MAGAGSQAAEEGSVDNHLTSSIEIKRALGSDRTRMGLHNNWPNPSHPGRVSMVLGALGG